MRAPRLFGFPPAGDGAALDVAVLGIPSDLGNGVMPGARYAPAALRRHAVERGVPDARPPRVGRLPAPAVADWGDVSVYPGEGMDARAARIHALCGEASAAGVRLVLLGGDHSVTLPAVECLQSAHPLAVVWLDAHTDLDELTSAHALNHKNVARRILCLPNVLRVVQVGHRGYTLEDELAGFPGRLTGFTPADLRRAGPAAVADALPPGAPVYLSVDVDVLDPSIAPGTATPVPGGLALTELLDVISEVYSRHAVIGADLVEVNPVQDPDARTVGAACRVVAELIRAGG